MAGIPRDRRKGNRRAPVGGAQPRQVANSRKIPATFILLAALAVFQSRSPGVQQCAALVSRMSETATDPHQHHHRGRALAAISSRRSSWFCFRSSSVLVAGLVEPRRDRLRIPGEAPDPQFP